jgi:hypothetical protein
MIFLQPLPGNFRGQIKFTRLVVSVPQPTQTAQHIREIYDANHPPVRIIDRRIMVKFNSVGNIRRQPPNISQHAATFAMRESQDFLLHFAQRGLRSLCLPQHA